MPIYFSFDYASEAALRKQVRALNLRRLARNVWTDESGDDAEIINRHCHRILSKLMPGAVINRRSGFTYKPENGVIFVSHPRTRSLELPGLTIHADGAEDGRQEDDVPLNAEGTLFGASPIRALLENANERGRPESRANRLSRSELHEQIARIVTSNTPQQNQNLVSMVLQRPKSPERESIQAFLDAAIHSRPTVDTDSASYKAVTGGKPFDSQRVQLFMEIASALEEMNNPFRPVIQASYSMFTPFYEAYFSNYIEGTEFNVDEAEAIVFGQQDFDRPEDAHDVSSTYAIVNDGKEMSRRFTTANEFMESLRDRHAQMMKVRPSALPGQWKNRANRAGSTVFVAPEFVVGTLEAGWDIWQTISDPFARAVFGMFFVSEVHPFTDGNGRAARITMNNELHSAGMHRIIIPTILRTDYNSALTRGTAGNGIQGLWRVLDHAQKWVSLAPFDSLKNGEWYLSSTNALMDSLQAERDGTALQLMTPNEIEYLLKIDQT